MSKLKQSSKNESASSSLLSQMIREAEAEARNYLPSPPPPKDSKPTLRRKNDLVIVRADGRRETVRGGKLERVVPFDPDKLAASIPRDALLMPVPTDAAVKLDKYWRGFQIPNAYLSDGTNSKIAIHLLATCLLAQNEPKLSSHQLLVVGHNIGILRMMLRMYSDQKLLSSQVRHAKDYCAARRALELFNILRKKHPNALLISDSEGVIALDDRVITQLKSEGYSSYSRRTVNGWRRAGTPKEMRKKGRTRKT